MALASRFRGERIFDELDDIRMTDVLEGPNLAVEANAFIVGSNHLEAEIGSRCLILDVKGGFLLAGGQWPDKGVVPEQLLCLLDVDGIGH